MISLNRIIEAHKKIAPHVNYTPLVYSDFLSQNRTVKLKLESLQITGSFKLRGAVNKLRGSIAPLSKDFSLLFTSSFKEWGLQSSETLGKITPLFLKYSDVLLTIASFIFLYPQIVMRLFE